MSICLCLCLYVYIHMIYTLWKYVCVCVYVYDRCIGIRYTQILSLCLSIISYTYLIRHIYIYTICIVCIQYIIYIYIYIYHIYISYIGIQHITWYFPNHGSMEWPFRRISEIPCQLQLGKPWPVWFTYEKMVMESIAMWSGKRCITSTFNGALHSHHPPSLHPCLYLQFYHQQFLRGSPWSI